MDGQFKEVKQPALFFPVLRERLLGADLARGLAVLFMISVHVLLVYSDAGVQASVFGRIIYFLGGPPAAPVFMFLMGLSFSYTDKKEIKLVVIRGIKIFLSGYLLNFLRGVLPLLTAQLTGSKIIETMSSDQSSLINIFLMADILQFAGLALILMALIRKFRLNKYILILSALIIMMVSPYLWSKTGSVPVIENILDLFWGDKPLGGFVVNMISFPVFPWLAFPLIGMAAGSEFAESKDLKKTYRFIGISGAVITAVGFAIIAPDYAYHFNDYYHSRPGAMIFMSGFVLLWLYLCHRFTEIIKENFLFKLLYSWSRKALTIYFIHWILIIWGIAVLGKNSSSLLSSVLIMLSVAMLSHFISMGYGILIRRIKLKRKSKYLF